MPRKCYEMCLFAFSVAFLLVENWVVDKAREIAIVNTLSMPPIHIISSSVLRAFALVYFPVLENASSIRKRKSLLLNG